MTPQVVSIQEDAPITRACEVMMRARVHGLPVIAASGATGWISSMDIVQWVAASAQLPAPAVEEPEPLLV